MRFLLLCTYDAYSTDLIRLFTKHNTPALHEFETKNIGTNKTVDPYDVNYFLTFDAILIDSVTYGIANCIEFGDVLSAYSDAGGGIVCCCYTNTTGYNQDVISGRFKSELYHPLLYGSTYLFDKNLQVTKVEPAHEVFANVDIISGGSYCGHADTKEATGSKVLARFADGYPCLAEKWNKYQTALVLAFNLPAASSVSHSSFYVEGQCDTSQLLFNCLVYAGKSRVNGKSVFRYRKNMLTMSSYKDITVTFK